MKHADYWVDCDDTFDDFGVKFFRKGDASQ